MPFDGKDYKTNTVADVLRRARALIDSPEKIVCGRFTAPDGHCTEAAIRAAAGAPFAKTTDEAAIAYAYGVIGLFAQANDIKGAVWQWHDTTARTPGMSKARLCRVLTAAFDKAIALAEAGE